MVEVSMTFDEIAQQLGVSRQRVQQIYQAAILKLKRKIDADYPDLRTRSRVPKGPYRRLRKGPQ